MSEQDLFRQEAIKAQSNKLDGEVIIAQPVSATLLTLSLMAAVAAVFVFLSTSSFNRKETVMGFLQPENGISRIAAPRNGVVEAVFVRDGDIVERGQPLLLLRTPEHLAGGASLNTLMATNLQEQITLLSNRKQQLERQAEFQEHELKQRVAFHSSQLEELLEQQDLARERLGINERRLTHLRSLTESGLLAIEEIRQQQELILNVRQQFAELRGNRQSHRAQLEQLSGELARLPGDMEQQLSLINSEITRLEHQQLELNARGEVLITASVGGIVTNLIVETGQHVQPSSSLVTIVPADSELKAILLIPTRAYGFVQTGQMTRIRFDAFPYQRFGLFEGQISKTSRSIVLPNEVQMPVVTQEPVYWVEATLAAQEIHAYGDSMPLQAGMLLSADVMLEQRSLLEWLFEPLLSLKGRM